MAFDLIVKNGWIVDGTGFPKYRADVGVKDGLIAEIGRIETNGTGTRHIDAEGLIVAPGFVDIHTHFDAQLTWDPLLTSSCYHGVTSVVIGNCGFTVTPCRPQDRDYIMGMLATVEGMPLAALRAGLQWEWETFPEYLSLITTRYPVALNVGAFVGHSAFRYYVMGDESRERIATTEEIAQMKEILREGLLAGALGFATSTADIHTDHDQKPVPSRLADEREFEELCSVLRDLNVGCVQSAGNIPDRAILDIGRPVIDSAPTQMWQRPDAWRRELERKQAFFDQGAQLWGQTTVARTDYFFDLTGEPPMFMNPFDKMPAWRDAIYRTIPEKLKALADPAVRDRMRADIADPTPRVFSKNWNDLVVEAPAKPENEKYRGRSIADIAKELGKDPLDAFLDLALDEQLKTHFQFVGYLQGDKLALTQIVTNPYVIPGMSDAGAHVDFLCNYNLPIQLINNWYRDEKIMTIEEAIRRVTSFPAKVYGIRNRGAISVGMAADLVVFDVDRIRPLEAQVVHDMPGGAMRLVQGAEGIRCTIVNGEIVMDEGRHSGNFPGQLIVNEKAKKLAPVRV